MAEIISKPYNLIFIISVVIIMIVWFIIALMSWDWNKKKYNLNDDKIFQKAFRKCNLWLTVSTFWMISEYIFTILPFEATVIVVYLDALDEPSEHGIIAYSIISLAFIGFAFAINPKYQMRCYRRAYVKLDNALNVYIEAHEKGDQKEIKKAKLNLITAIDDGEKSINGSYDVE